MRLYFVRHAESEANLLKEISNRGLKHGLTGRGRAQAAALGDNLHPACANKIYTSPLLRAVQTAEILASALGLPVETSDALREYDCGVLEGKSDPDSWALHRQVRLAWLEQGAWEQRIPGGESFLDIQARFEPFIQRLLQSPQGASLILVGHGGLYTCMLPLVLANVSFAFATQPFPNTAYVLARAQPDGSLRCLEWCGAPVPPAPGEAFPA
ncbi:MAG: histidine phosphatase family protein [Chloroflexota bacterium]